MPEPIIGILGGTGPQGRGLAMRLAMAGMPVRLGSRSEQRAAAIAEDLNKRLHEAGCGNHAPLAGQHNQAVAAESEIVLLTVPFESAVETLLGVCGHLRPGAVLVDVTVPLSFSPGGVKVLVPPEGSGSLTLRKVLPEGLPLVGAFKTLPAHLLEEINQPLACSTFIYGDDREARGRVMALAASIPTLAPVDVGGLSAAATVEGMTALLIRINRRLKSKTGRYQVVGTGP